MTCQFIFKVGLPQWGSYTFFNECNLCMLYSNKEIPIVATKMKRWQSTDMSPKEGVLLSAGHDVAPQVYGEEYVYQDGKTLY